MKEGGGKQVEKQGSEQAMRERERGPGEDLPRLVKSLLRQWPDRAICLGQNPALKGCKDAPLVSTF